MIKRILILSLTILTIVSCSNKGPQFQLSGHIEGLEQDEVVYLYNKIEKKDIDSVNSKDGGFLFTGTVAEPSLHYIIVRREGETVKYKGFWLENTSISINGSLATLEASKVEGSEMQKQADAFNEQIEYLAEQFDDLYAQYNPKNKEEAEIISAKIDSLMAIENHEKVKFIKENPSYLYSAFLAKRVVRAISPEEGQSIYDALSDEMKSTKYGVVTKEYLDLNKNMAIGVQSAEISLPNTEGQEISLSSLQGKYVLVDFWASWCGPCRRESPYLTKAYEQYADKGFEIYAVSIDKEKDKWLEAVAEDTMTWTTVLAEGAFDSKEAMMYGVQYIPYNFLLDPEGKIIEMHLRGEALIEKLDELL